MDQYQTTTFSAEFREVSHKVCASLDLLVKQIELLREDVKKTQRKDND